MSLQSDTVTGLLDKMQAITSSDLAGASLNAVSAQARLLALRQGCTACAQQEACRLWAEAHHGQRLPAPDFCGNRHLFGPSAAYF